MSTEIHGRVDDGYGAVADAFRSNFEDRHELGAAFALRVDGELVVDIWGGVADKQSGALWQEDTLQLVFSTTKGLAAICLGVLVNQGRVDLAEKVATYWPEFAAHGKDSLTVAQMMSHQAGLAALDERPDLGDILAVTPMVEALAAQAPLWEPGTAHGYHAVTYGWLAAELCRRADGRRMNQILQQEICEPLGVEAWMGLPEAEEPRVARLEPADRPTGEELEFMRKVAGPGTLGGRALTLDGALLFAGRELPWNTREIHATEMPGANGITNARALATIYAATIGDVDGVRLFDDATVEAFRAEQTNGPDECLITDTRYGVGFWLDNELSPMLGAGSFGHPGAGGSLGYADPEAGVGYGYVMNQMGGGIAGDPRSIVLNDAVRACL